MSSDLYSVAVAYQKANHHELKSQWLYPETHLFFKKTTWESVQLNLKGGMFIALWPQQRLASCLSSVVGCWSSMQQQVLFSGKNPIIWSYFGFMSQNCLTCPPSSTPYKMLTIIIHISLVSDFVHYLQKHWTNEYHLV